VDKVGYLATVPLNMNDKTDPRRGYRPPDDVTKKIPEKPDGEDLEDTIVEMPDSFDEEPTILDEQQREINRVHRELNERFAKRREREWNDILKTIQDTKEREQILAILNNQAEQINEFLRVVAEEKCRDSQEADTDKISGLLRKDAFEKMYEKSLSLRQPGENMVMVAFDLDKFKDINESIGHVEADKILKRIGLAIQETTRVYDFASRIGGDEFTILLTKVNGDSDILKLIERIAAEISKITWEHKGKKTKITFSAGFTVIPDKNNPKEIPYVSEVRARADKTAGFSKQLGRNRITVQDGEKYTAYTLTDKQYIETESGNISELEIDTLESCLREVISNLQRIIEEIERAWGAELKKYIGFVYKDTNGKPAKELADLSIKQIAGLLLDSRKKQKEEVGK